MKIAVTSKGKDLDSEVDPRFGRAAYILIVDTGTLEVEVVDNAENVNAFKGAGIQAATRIHDKGARVLLTGFCGPNAFKTLQAAGIKVANDMKGSVRETVTAYNDGLVSFAEAANVDGHW
jgi:predicted Fe-Mo cluster-binding NifX family protein